MTYIEKISYNLGRKDELPNQELAAILAKEKNHSGIQEIVSYLNDKNSSIRNNCIKVLYEIGAIEPTLIIKYVEVFVKLLDSKANRMVWGAMTALAMIAEVEPLEVWPHREKIKDLVDTGSVITADYAVKTLIHLSKAGTPCYNELIKELLQIQSKCRSKDFAKIAEDMWLVIQPQHLEMYIKILETRKLQLSSSAQKRVSKILKNFVEG